MLVALVVDEGVFVAGGPGEAAGPFVGAVTQVVEVGVVLALPFGLAEIEDAAIIRGVALAVVGQVGLQPDIVVRALLLQQPVVLELLDLLPFLQGCLLYTSDAADE